ncbi:LCP family protein [Nocardioides fonticola]|uniref:LCP family protein n=1 Tax=Nocardioides fonticola TaxID=450363 RepID=A0ABP7XL52_9ACTN
MTSTDDVPLTPSSTPGKRRAKPPRRRRIGTALMVTLIVLTMVTGLSGAYLYRHLSSNLTVLDLSDRIVGEQPDKVEVEGPKQPINLLVMGSDTRDGAGNNIDGLTGGGARSDTTIFFHVSADRTRAYGVSIPRDSMVDRPACKADDGSIIPAATYQMWNAAYALGGPACTVQQFQRLTGIRLDHFVVVDFEGFRGMVDAVGGVQVCIPETIDDRAHGIYLPAGTRKLRGQQALNYVRERYAVSGGSDIGRMKRQQAFVASMAHAVVSAGTLSRPDRILSFLDAATKSLTLDSGLGNLVKIARLGSEFAGIGLDNIRFLTIPNTVDPQNPNHLVWTPDAATVWSRLKNDEPLARRLNSDAISAANVPNGNGTKTDAAKAAELRDAGLCA